MSQKAARIGGEARGACSLGALLPQSSMGLGQRVCRHGPRSRYATGATVASQPAEHEERGPRAGCRRLPVVVFVVGPHSSSKRP